MKEKEFHVTLKCLFCGCDLSGEKDKEYHSGDLLKCQQCNELNDYDSLMQVAHEEGKAEAVDYVKDELAKMLKNITR